MAKQVLLKHEYFDLMAYDGANPLDFASAFTEWAENYPESNLYIGYSDEGIEVSVAYQQEETDAEERYRLEAEKRTYESRRNWYEQLKKEFETPDLDKFL